MNFDDCFTAYYTQYRTEATVPASSDDEYKIAIPLFNEAINRWSRYDATYWKELYQTLQLSGDGDNTIATNTTEYAAPDDMREAGGFVRLKDSSGNTQFRYPIIEIQDVQFKGDNQAYAYFVGNPTDGFTMNLNPTPPTSSVGMAIDYVYYKKPTFFVNGGTETTEMNDPYFIVHRALASRFRGSRNPFRNDAKADAEDVLKTMQLDNNSGNWADPWQLEDHSGSVWGQSYGSP